MDGDVGLDRLQARSRPVMSSNQPDEKEYSVKALLSATLVLLLVNGSLAADTSQPEGGIVSLFDGRTLDGWKVGENADVFQVRDGMIVMELRLLAASLALMNSSISPGRVEGGEGDAVHNTLFLPGVGVSLLRRCWYSWWAWPSGHGGVTGEEL